MDFIIRKKDGTAEVYKSNIEGKDQESVHAAFEDAISKYPGCKVELF